MAYNDPFYKRKIIVHARYLKLENTRFTFTNLGRK